MRAGILLLPCYAAFSGQAGVPPPQLRRASSRLLQDITRPARGTRGTADGEVVTGPALLSAEELVAERPGPRVEVREVIDSMMAAVHRDFLNTPEHPYLGCEVAMRFLSSTHQAASFEKQNEKHELESTNVDYSCFSFLLKRDPADRCSACPSS